MNSSNKRIDYTQIQQLALVAVFIGIILTFFLLICFIPKHEGELSPNERRKLAEAPDASFSNIMNGGFSKEVDTWLEDHFPGRSFFVSLYSYLNRYTGRNVTESIIKGAGDRLFTAPVELNEATLAENGSRIKEFAEKNSLDTNLVIIPSSGYILEGDLPKLHREYADDRIIEGFANAAGENTALLPVKDIFSYSMNAEGLYYRTDHHLTMEGSYLLYSNLSESLGFTPVAAEEFLSTAYEFYGTSYGSSGLTLTKPDSLEVWTLPGDEYIYVATYDGANRMEHMGMIDETCLEDGVVDRYACYLYSNHGMTIIENPAVEEGTLLVLKDSYGNAIVPFLAHHYNKIIMIDVRYYSSTLPMPSELVSEYGIKDFLVIYGTDSVQTTSDLGWLR